MPTSSTLSEQLAALGVQLPVWPEEPEGDGPTGNWIERGQACAETLRLWRAQLRSAAAIEGTGGERLINLVKDVGKQSPWDQSVIRYLLCELQGVSDYQHVQAAAKLVAATDCTAAQRLGVALELARGGFLVSAVDSIKNLVELQQLNEQECLELCALLVANLKTARSPAGSDASWEGVHYWLQCMTLQLQATTMLATAASAAGGEQNRAALVRQLETLLALAAERRPEPESDEFAAIENVRTRERRKQAHTQGKPILRAIHHLSCTGGTVISKCIAAMPDVALISEVNPHHRKAGGPFQPTNPLLLLEKSYRQLTEREVKKEFQLQISSIMKICEQDDVDLVIRDHSHSDFCMGTAPSAVCPIADYLSDEYTLRSVITVRHPLDSYLGMRAQNWNRQFKPSTLNEYSRRYLTFLDRYNKLPLQRYEDFCDNPCKFMKELCNLLEISYHPAFEKHFGSFLLTGDSGRKEVLRISLPPRRAVPLDVLNEAENSPFYIELKGRLEYE